MRSHRGTHKLLSDAGGGIRTTKNATCEQLLAVSSKRLDLELLPHSSQRAPACASSKRAWSIGILGGLSARATSSPLLRFGYVSSVACWYLITPHQLGTRSSFHVRCKLNRLFELCICIQPNAHVHSTVMYGCSVRRDCPHLLFTSSA